MADLALGNIKPIGADNIVVEAKYVKGSYVVVTTTGERDTLKGDFGENIIKGSLCYCQEDSKFYQYNGSSWEEFNYANLGAVNADFVIDKIAKAVSSVLTYKGTKDTTSDLPSTENTTIGDVWNITKTCPATNNCPAVNAGDNVAWTGTSWDVLAGTIDLSNYYNRGDINSIITSIEQEIDEHTHGDLNTLLNCIEITEIS
jgi:hypothetical protein